MHTFLAAILFLSPKSIIYNFNNEEDIWKAGDLAEKKFTITSLTIKSLILINILFPARFFSKFLSSLAHPRDVSMPEFWYLH